MAEENNKQEPDTSQKKEEANQQKVDDSQKAKSPESEKATEDPEDAAADSSSPGFSKITDEKLAEIIGNRDFAGIMGDAEDMKKRQHLLNTKKYKTEIKKPNPGKMPNNEDPFPVDLKIEEFETHYPPTTIYKLKVHQKAKEAGIAVADVAWNAEKRLVKLENNLSTLFRLFFRLGSRMHINCLYWGGVSPFRKYVNIRCLCDDRVSDGQNMQIDQCLYCTRYEPVYG